MVERCTHHITKKRYEQNIIIAKWLIRIKQNKRRGLKKIIKNAIMKA